MIRTSSLVVFECKSKACAPPPVGTGGSTGGGSHVKDAIDRSRELMDSDPDPRSDASTVDYYVGEGALHINGMLRRPRKGEGWPRIERMIGEMDSAFDKYGVQLSQDATVHRGMTLGSMKEVRKAFREGRVVTDKGFVSTSVDPDQARRFARSTPKVVGVRLEIKLPKGTTILAGREDEQELILRRNSQFRVGSVREVSEPNINVVISLELVQ
jgi:hypothetical protein